MSEPTREELVELINRTIEKAEVKLAEFKKTDAIAEKLIQLSDRLIDYGEMFEDDYQALYSEWKIVYAEWKETRIGSIADGIIRERR